MPIGQRISPSTILTTSLGLLFLFSPIQSTTMDHRSPITLDRSFNGKKVEVKVGDEIQIQLKGVGSTGYEWHFDTLDNNFFEITGREKREIARQGDVVGTPYIAIWKLRAKTPGSSTIKMIYYRVWEGKDKAIDQFEIHIDVTS